MTKHDLSDFKKSPKKNLLNGIKEPNTFEVEVNQQVAEKSKRKGRRPKEAEERLTEKVTVNFTLAEIESLNSLAIQNFNIPLPKLIRGILKENKII